MPPQLSSISRLLSMDSEDHSWIEVNRQMSQDLSLARYYSTKLDFGFELLMNETLGLWK